MTIRSQKVKGDQRIWLGITINTEDDIKYARLFHIFHVLDFRWIPEYSTGWFEYKQGIDRVKIKNNGFVLFLLQLVLKYLVFNASLIYHFVNSTFIRIFLEHFFVSIVPHEFKNLNKKLRCNSNIIQSLATRWNIL